MILNELLKVKGDKMEKNNLTKVASLRDVKEITSFSRATIYRKIKDAGFPKPMKISAKRVVWDEAKVRAWLNEQVSQFQTH